MGALQLQGKITAGGYIDIDRQRTILQIRNTTNCHGCSAQLHGVLPLGNLGRNIHRTRHAIPTFSLECSLLEVVIRTLGTGEPQIEIFHIGNNEVIHSVSAVSEDQITTVVGSQGYIGGIGSVDSFISFLKSSKEDILNIAEGLTIVCRGRKDKRIPVIGMVTQ